MNKFKTIKAKYEIKNIIPISAQYEHNINYLLQLLNDYILLPNKVNLYNSIKIIQPRSVLLKINNKKNNSVVIVKKRSRNNTN